MILVSLVFIRSASWRIGIDTAPRACDVAFCRLFRYHRYMPTITQQKVKKSAIELEKIIKQAKRKLFEFETLSRALELRAGNFLEYKNPKAFFDHLEKVQ